MCSSEIPSLPTAWGPRQTSPSKSSQTRVLEPTGHPPQGLGHGSSPFKVRVAALSLSSNSDRWRPTPLFLSGATAQVLAPALRFSHFPFSSTLHSLGCLSPSRVRMFPQHAWFLSLAEPTGALALCPVHAHSIQLPLNHVEEPRT